MTHQFKLNFVKTEFKCFFFPLEAIDKLVFYFIYFKFNLKSFRVIIGLNPIIVKFKCDNYNFNGFI